MTRYARWRLPARILAIVTVASYVVTSSGCAAYRWRAVPIADLSLDKEQIQSRRVRLFAPEGRVTMRVRSIDFPYVMGVPETDTGLVEFDLRTAREAKIIDRDRATTTPLAEGAVGAMLTRTVQFSTDGGNVLLRVEKVQYPWVEGRPYESAGLVRFDLRRAQRLEIHELSGGRTALKTIGIVAGVVAAVVLIVALTKDSCPFVYVDRGEGLELVGEAYPGAAFASIQRDDLLPLPDFETGRLHVQLRNEARETQYTDRIELVVADHPPETRVLSTFDARPIVVGPAVTPTIALDHDGRDVTSAVLRRDENVWERDVPAVAAAKEELQSDQLEASFVLRGGERPVLEIVGGNTAWLDLVFGRFFAAMGDRLSQYIAAGNDPTAADRITQWKRREGIDLTVEIARGNGWHTVATVPTVGPAALREVAVPLPELDGRNGPVKIRLRGGLGFWRVDRIAMSTQLDVPVRLHRLQPSSARGTGGRDELQAIAAVDRRYQVLELMDERLDLTFDVPSVPQRQVRSLFLFTNGYYNVHPPVQSSWSPGTLKAIRDEPGAFSRFSRDLAREYMRIASGSVSGVRR